jgi:hypothetical protein
MNTSSHFLETSKLNAPEMVQKGKTPFKNEFQI